MRLFRTKATMDKPTGVENAWLEDILRGVPSVASFRGMCTTALRLIDLE